MHIVSVPCSVACLVIYCRRRLAISLAIALATALAMALAMALAITLAGGIADFLIYLSNRFACLSTCLSIYLSICLPIYRSTDWISRIKLRNRIWLAEPTRWNRTGRSELICPTLPVRTDVSWLTCLNLPVRIYWLVLIHWSESICSIKLSVCEIDCTNKPAVLIWIPIYGINLWNQQSDNSLGYGTPWR